MNCVRSKVCRFSWTTTVSRKQELCFLLSPLVRSLSHPTDLTAGTFAPGSWPKLTDLTDMGSTYWMTVVVCCGISMGYFLIFVSFIVNAEIAAIGISCSKCSPCQFSKMPVRPIFLNPLLSLTTLILVRAYCCRGRKSSFRCLCQHRSNGFHIFFA